MSYILDALRKSHHDREEAGDRILQQSTAEARRVARHRRQVLWMGIGLLSVNAALLGWLASDRLLGQRESVVAADGVAAPRGTSVAVDSPTATPSAASMSGSVSPTQDAAPAKSPASVADTRAAPEVSASAVPPVATDVVQASSAGPAPDAPKPMSLNDATLVVRDMALERQQDFERRRSLVTPAAHGAAMADESFSSGDEGTLVLAPQNDVYPLPAKSEQPGASRAGMTEADLGNIPLFMNMDETFRSHWTALSLDVHVFSPTAIERFVFINMEKYREGETTKEGLLVSRIVTDGVILEGLGQRFRLTPQ